MIEHSANGIEDFLDCNRLDAFLLLLNALIQPTTVTIRLMVNHVVTHAGWKPLPRLIPRTEYRDAGHSGCRRKMHRPAVVTYEEHRSL